MIVEWFLGLIETVVEWFFSLFDGFEIPSAISSPDSAFGELLGNVHGLGVWVPWGVIAAVVGAVLLTWITMFVIKLVKQVLAHVPAFGGAG